MELRRAVNGIAALILFLASGCNAMKHSAPLPETVRTQVRTVAVVPAAFIPRTDFTAVMRMVEDPMYGLMKKEERSVNAPDERTAVIWKQTGETAWSEGWNPSFATGMVAGALLHPVVGVAAVFSTDVSIGVALSTERNRKIDEDIGQAVPLAALQLRTADLLAEAGKARTDLSFRTFAGRGPAAPGEKPGYGALAGEGVDLVLEVAVNDVGFISGSQEDPSTSVFLHAGIRAIRVADGAELSDGVSISISRPQTVTTWLRDDALMLREQIAKAQADIAARTVERLFLLYEGGEPGGEGCMLEAYSPQAPGLKFGDMALNVPKIDSLQPLFQWERFPRDRDKPKDPAAGPSEITDVAYDLRIWRNVGGYPDTLVYERSGMTIAPAAITKHVEEVSESGERRSISRTLHAAEHRLERPLDPLAEYYWAVRAQFKLNGRPRLTRWSYSRIPRPPSIPDPCQADHIPLMHYYRFRTP